MLAAVADTLFCQALLTRHETFMNEAEEQRRRMDDTIGQLEKDKKELKASNAKTIDENRYLIDQLEDLNNNASSSEAHIDSLTATLESTRNELDKLATLAARASHLEAQLSAMETEKVRLDNEVVEKSEETQTAVQRWRVAEKTVTNLSEQIDRIEHEAKEERARHSEIVTRLERREAVEQELKSAAGKLKEVAAAATAAKENGTSGVVTSFVKDILQDNANLQMGILELREMLMGSNEEVQNLRGQMLVHQPVQSVDEEKDEKSSLNTELLNMTTTEMPDLHVHHHYYAAPKADSYKGKPPSSKRPKRKGYVTSPGLRTPSAGFQTPHKQLSPSRRNRQASSAATILSQTSASVPSPSQHTRKWSWQSMQGAPITGQSSVPGSPSSYQDQSIFDAIDDALDSSRPTSPNSTVLGSPDFPPRHAKGGSTVSVRSLPIQPVSVVSTHLSGSVHGSRANDSYGEGNSFSALDESTIVEEAEDDTPRPSTLETIDDIAISQDYKPFQHMRSRMHRASSAESIFSIQGVAKPIKFTKHSQLLSGPRTSLGASMASVGPVTSSTSAVGKSSKASRHYDSSSYNRLLLGNTSSTSPTTTSNNSAPVRPTFGKKLGGWVAGKWGIAPVASSADLRGKASLATPMRSNPPETQDSAIDDDGVAANRLSTHVEAVKIDSNALEDALGGE